MNGKTFKWRHALWVAIFLFSLLGTGQNAKAQEIPNGDNDVLWERPLNGRTVNDAKFHPINGNIIAAVDYEIWEIDPKDGHTIRVFEGGTASGQYDKFTSINISSDGNTIVTDEGSGIKGIIIWDYQTGTIRQNFDNGEKISDIQCTGLYPDNNKVIYFSFVDKKYHLNIYDISQNKLILQKDIYPQSPDFFRLSNDGKLIAFGFRKESVSGGLYFNMELWDAEKFTQIQDLGSFKVGGFKDIQFSNDNQYLGYKFESGGFSLFRINNETFSNFYGYGYVQAFAFSVDNTKLLLDLSGKSNNDNPPTYLFKLFNMDSIYKFSYTFCYGIIRMNYHNEIFTKGVDSNFVQTIKLISNKWYEVGVKSPIENKNGITSTKYTENTLNLTILGIDFINTLVITDTLGKKLYVQNEILVINNQTEIPLLLPTGNYLLRLTANGKEYTSKFVVVR